MIDPSTQFPERDKIQHKDKYKTPARFFLGAFLENEQGWQHAATVTDTATVTRTVELVEVRTLTLLEPMGSNVVLGSMEKKSGVWSILVMNR
jgi:hypothetical protein